MALNNDWEIAVIGGGPAGTASAFYAAKLGFKTILFEKNAYPHSKPCGGALSPRVIPLLGKEALKSINCEINELRLFSPSYKSISIKNAPGGYVTRREDFDQAMAKDARDAGANVIENCRVKTIRELPTGDFEISSGNITITAKYLILATGFQKKAFIRSPFTPEEFEEDYLAMTVFSETPVDNKLTAAVNFPAKLMAIYFGAVPNGYGWYFVKNGYINIGIGATAKLLGDTGGAINAYHHFVNSLREKGCLPKGMELNKERAYPLPFKRTVKKSVFGNALLVGDCAGFVSPVTGEGIYYAIKGAKLAIEAIERNLKKGTHLSSYHESWKKDFGNSLNKYGYCLREKLYKNSRRMELAINLCAHDQKMALLMNNLVYGVYSYGEVLWKGLLRLPVTLIKTYLPR
ncbi:MAG: NAD(P)/FAD-dependent oxidoreductase [Acidobacteria bacterium]|jgi:geranylgeranyl reductase family protein|nr:NAD(P)/FAD-dependent oxidoreductase [Acidobacteriota bacterium]